MSGRSPWEIPPTYPSRVVPGTGGMMVPANFDPAEQEEIKALCLQTIEAIFPELVQAMREVLERAQNLLPEKDPAKLDRQLRTLGILPRDQPTLADNEKPLMDVIKLSEELNATPDEAQEALDALEVLGYVTYARKAPSTYPGYRLTF